MRTDALTKEEPEVPGGELLEWSAPESMRRVDQLRIELRRAPRLVLKLLERSRAIDHPKQLPNGRRSAAGRL